MHFGSLPLDDAAGATLAHGLTRGRISFRKGRVLSADDVAALRAAGVSAVIAVRLDDDDLGEDDAAARVAGAVSGPHLSVGAAHTGRVNLFAEAAGLLVVDAAAVDRINLLDEAVTLATLPAFAPVASGAMVATVKVIPFAAPRAVVERAEAAAVAASPVLRVAPFRPITAVLVQTTLPGVKTSVLDKTVAVTRDRLSALGGTLLADSRCAHETAALADSLTSARRAGADLVLIAGASAITDRRDVVPAAIESAGGTVEHFGMPVDPGNLILLARLGGTPVLGLPGCARSPKLNGFDWVLQRLAAGVPPAREDIMRMGVGGLLAEIPSRPLPRLGTPADAAQPRMARVAAVVLAAGRSSRMGGTNKLTADIGGTPLVRRTVESVLASRARPVVVVTGHQADAVKAALAGLPVAFAHNPLFADGLSASLRTGIEAVPAESDGALVCLGDMPRVSAALLDGLIAAFNPVEGRAIVVPVSGGRRGNPVLWGRAFFEDVLKVAGDTGARHLIGANAEQVCEVVVDDEAVLADVDTPESLRRLRQTLDG